MFRYKLLGYCMNVNVFNSCIYTCIHFISYVLKNQILVVIFFLSIHAYASTLIFSVMYIKFSTSYCRGNLGQVIQSTIWNKYMLLELYFVVYCCKQPYFSFKLSATSNYIWNIKQCKTYEKSEHFKYIPK